MKQKKDEVVSQEVGEQVPTNQEFGAANTGTRPTEVMSHSRQNYITAPDDSCLVDLANKVIHGPNPSNDDIPPFPGLHVIIGEAGSGKSARLQALAKRLAKPGYVVPIAYADEPDWRAVHNDGDWSMADVCELYWQHDGSQVTVSIMFVDSISAKLYQGGNLSKGGVSQNALFELARASALCEYRGLMRVCVVNPQNRDLVPTLYQNLAGVCTSVTLISGEAGQSTGRKWNGGYYDRFSGSASEALAYISGLKGDASEVAVARPAAVGAGWNPVEAHLNNSDGFEAARTIYNSMRGL